MKKKKLLLPAIILVVAIIAIAVCSVVSSIAYKPTVTEGEFPFSITYELNGETVTIEDVYVVKYIGNGGYADTISRIYQGSLVSFGDETTVYTLKNDDNGRIELWTHFYADYMMGDAQGSDYFDEEPFEPRIYYYDSEETYYDDEETLAEQGVKLISFEYPEPIENSFVFSHISYFSGAVVPPVLLISLLALVATAVFVRKEKELTYKAIDIVSIVLSIGIGLTLIPLLTIVSMLVDINGGGPEIYRQVLYFLPSFSVLCIAASVALRRKGYGIVSFVAVLTVPAAFVVYLIGCGIGGWL